MRSRSHFLCGVAAVAVVTAISGQAHATDLPILKAPPPKPARLTWEGLYLGAHAGYGWSRFRGGMIDPVVGSGVDHNLPTGNFTGKGLGLGGHAGYNLQSGNIVYGLEVDATVAAGWQNRRCKFENRGSSACTVAFVSSQLDWLASVRGRLGMTFDRSLIYATGGVAAAKVRHTACVTDTCIEHNSVRIGGVVGAGWEWKHNPSLSFRLEGLHYIFNQSRTENVDPNANAGVSGVYGLRNVSMIRVGMSWYPQAYNESFGQAGGMVLKAPPRLAGPTWAGLYMGGHIGYGWSKFDGRLLDNGGEPVIGFTANGLAAGFHAGYNWQSGSFVYGLEADATVTPGWQKKQCQVGRANTACTYLSSQLDWLASIRGRLGMTFDRTLVYATGGVAFSKVNHAACDSTCVVHNGVRTGGVVGGGVEWKYNPQLSFRLEGLHYIFNKTSVAVLDGDLAEHSVRNASVIRVGASWHPQAYDGAFAAAGPVYKGASLAAPNWSGAYVGGNLGYGWAKNRVEMHDPQGGTTREFPATDLNASGIAPGLHVGYNWQSRNWVFGVEADATITPGWRKQICKPYPRSDRCETVILSSQLDWLATVRGRLGMTFDRSLVYATGGLALAKTKHTACVTTTCVELSHVKAGGVVGGGIEWKYNSNLSLRLEGLHYIFNESRTESVEVSAVATQGLRDATVVRVGASWHLPPI